MSIVDKGFVSVLASGVTLSVRPELTSSDREAWLALWESSPHSHPRQHPDFAAVVPTGRHKVLFVSATRDESTVLAGLFMIRPSWVLGNGALEAVCQRGPIVDDPSVLGGILPALVNWFRNRKIGRIHIAPRWLDPDAGVVESILIALGWTPSANRRFATGIVDLAPDDSRIMQSFSQSTRAQVRLAERRGIIIEPAKSQADVDEFFRILSRLQTDRHLNPTSHHEFSQMAKAVLLDKNLGVLLLASQDGHILGGLSVLRDSRTGYPSRYALAPQMPPHLATVRVGAVLFWHAMRWARARGCVWFDMEGWSAETPVTSDAFHFHAFKAGFRPRTTTVLGTYATRCHSGIAILTGVRATGLRLFNGGVRKTYRLVNAQKRRRSLRPTVDSKQVFCRNSGTTARDLLSCHSEESAAK